MSQSSLMLDQPQYDRSALLVDAPYFPPFGGRGPGPGFSRNRRSPFDPDDRLGRRRLVSEGLSGRIGKKQKPEHGMRFAARSFLEPFTSIRSGALPLFFPLGILTVAVRYRGGAWQFKTARAQPSASLN